MSASSSSGMTPRPRQRLLIWCSLWGGGAAWLLHLLAAWAFAEFGCLSPLASPGPLDVSWVAWSVLAVTALCLTLAGVSVWTSWLCGRETGAIPKTASFVMRYGLAANPLFMAIIITQAIPVFYYLRECGTQVLS